MSALSRVCFIGIGNMGWPMAACLLRAGFDVTVNDAVAGRATDFVAQVGGTAADDLREAVRGADAIITMLPTSNHVGEVVDKIRAGFRAGQILIDMSSGAPAATQKIAADLEAAGVIVLDAPVSGGVARA